jgi:nucleotide-binding universal stress UspA family protein
MYSHIIVPLDGSKLAESALPEAGKLAKITGAELVLVRVVDYSSRDRFGDFGMLYEYEAMAKALEEEREIATLYLTMLSNRLASEGHTVSTRLLSGIAAKAIVAEAKPGDVIVMATHGRTGVRRWFIGSIAEEVLRHSTVPVLLVRATELAPEAAQGREKVASRSS